MGDILSGQWWVKYFQEVYLPQIDVLVDSLKKKILPAFSDIDAEANDYANEIFNNFMNGNSTRPFNPEYDDADDFYDYSLDKGAEFAEYAQEQAFEYYSLLEGTKQTMLNVYAVILHHLFEQQLFLFYRKQVINPWEENNIKQVSIVEFRDALLKAGIEVNKFKSYEKTQELRHLANTIKHTLGNSNSELQKIRPDLYIHPSINNSKAGIFKAWPDVRLPLAGQDIFVTLRDIVQYSESIKDFFLELGEKLTNLN